MSKRTLRMDERIIRLVLLIAGIFLCIEVVALFGEEKVSLRVDPAIIMQGGNSNVYCKVPRREENRRVRIEAEFVQAKEYPMEGLNSPAIFLLHLTKVPCVGDEVQITCEVSTNINETYKARASLQVRGCSQKRSK